MFVQTVRSPGIAHLSYVVGAGAHAAVIDPRRDCHVYPRIALENGARITHIFETHRNEDYVVGSVELADITGAPVYHGDALPFAYGEPVSGGEQLEVGSLRLTVIPTPGHTFESISIAVDDRAYGDDTIAVFTGDALFVGDVGRTDFFPDRAEEVAGLLYDSIFDRLLPLGDAVIVLPAHGAGSVCGGNLSARELSTLGYERKHNPQLQHSREQFVRHKTSERHFSPAYFRRMEEYNLIGPPPLSQAAEPALLSADEFADHIAQGALALDVRSPEAYGGAHLPGSLALPVDMAARLGGYMLPFARPIGLIVDDTAQMRETVTQLRRIGYDNVTGYLHEGMHDWETTGREFTGMPQVHISQIKRRLDSGEPFTLLDVRTPREYQRGHLPGAVNIYVGELADRLEEVPAARPITTFCGSGHRAVVGASILEMNGFEQVENCLGSMMACRSQGCPLVRER